MGTFTRTVRISNRGDEMIKLLLLFVLLLLTALARFLVFDAFEPLMFAMIFLFPVASLVIFIISKKFANKERNYQPPKITGWSFYNIQKSLMIKKPLFYGDVKVGYVKRYFPHQWQYVLSDIIGFNWYLNLEIEIDQDIYNVQWYREKWFTNQDQWRIYKNGEQIGTAYTRINLKNTTKLKEAIEFQVGGEVYHTSASTVTSMISLTHNETLLGTLKRNHIMSNVQVIDIQKTQPEQVVALIVHSYYFKNN